METEARVAKPHDVSVVIVSYNTREQLKRCLACIEPQYQVIVVDNASSDGSVEMVREEFPHVTLIPNRQNLGFGAANNIGIKAASAPLILLLNSDAYAKPGAIARLADFMAVNPDAVACGGRLLNMDGSLQLSTARELTLWAVFCEQTYLEKVFPNSRLLNPYWNTTGISEPTPVTQVTGACLMLRPLETFDERYFLYCEDTDLCYRLSRHGKIYYVPQAEFTHELGSSAKHSRWISIARYNRGKELYFVLHHGAASAALCWLLDRLGALLRLLAWGFPTLLTFGAVGKFRRQSLQFFRVLTAPLTGPKRPKS